MKYFINGENHKVKLAWVAQAVDDEYSICWDMDGKEHTIPTSEVLDDGSADFVEVLIPIELPNGFTPPETFDDGRCMWCPFYCVEVGVDNYCSHKYYSRQNSCPIRNCF